MGSDAMWLPHIYQLEPKGVYESLPGVTVLATIRCTTPMIQTIKDDSENFGQFRKMTKQNREQRSQAPNHLSGLN